MRTHPPGQAYAKAFAATVLWGCSFIAMRHALDHAAPQTVVWMRNLLGSAFLFALLRWRGGPLLPHRDEGWRVVLLGLIFGAHLWIQAVALGSTTTMRAGWIIAFVPVVVAVGSWSFLGQRLRAIGWLGIAIASGGVLLLTATRPADLVHAASGDLLMLASTLTWASYTLLSMGPVRRNGAVRITASTLLISALPNMLASIGQPLWLVPPDAGAVLALLFLGLGASALALWLFTEAVTRIGAERASAFQYVQPVITMVAAGLLLHEPLSRELLLAGPVVLVGVWFVQLGKRTPSRPSE